MTLSVYPSLDVRAPHHEDVDEDARQEADDDCRQSVLHRDTMARHNLLPERGLRDPQYWSCFSIHESYFRLLCIPEPILHYSTCASKSSKTLMAAIESGTGCGTDTLCVALYFCTTGSPSSAPCSFLVRFSLDCVHSS